MFRAARKHLLLLTWVLLALAVPAFSSEGEAANPPLEPNVSFEALQELKGLIFGGASVGPRIVRPETTEAAPEYAVASRREFLELASEDYAAWTKPGFRLEESKDGEPLKLVRDLEKTAEGYERFQRIAAWARELEEREGPIAVGFVPTSMGQVVALQDPNRPKAGKLDVFEVPGIVRELPRTSTSMAVFRRNLVYGGHFFLILRSRLDPPGFQEEILYLRVDAPHLRPFSFVGPLLDVRIP